MTLDINIKQQTLQRLQQIQQKNTAIIQTYMSTVDSIFNTASSYATQLEAQVGKGMANIATEILAQFGIFFKGVNDYVGSIGSYDPSGHPLDSGGSGPGHAAGALFNTTGAAHMTVGEAGSETVAILRNPRTMLSSGGGDGAAAPITINFNGTSVRNDGDIRAIARAVEDVLNAKAARLGLRSLASGVG